MGNVKKNFQTSWRSIAWNAPTNRRKNLKTQKSKEKQNEGG